jgi:very-short-patch-repair endonuclease
MSNIPPLKKRRRELRNNPTPVEALRWNHLRRKQLLGKKFRQAIQRRKYAVDFYCDECIEACREDYEAQRTALLQSTGMKILSECWRQFGIKETGV